MHVELSVSEEMFVSGSDSCWRPSHEALKISAAVIKPDQKRENIKRKTSV